MQLLQKLMDILVGPPSCQCDPITTARQTIISAGYSTTIESQALARFDRRIALCQDVDDSLHAVMAWAESVSPS